VKRNAIALLVTISFVTVIMSLIGISSNLVDNSFKRVAAKHALIQNNLLFSDITDILKEVSGDINDSIGLDIFLSIPLFFENRQNSLSVDITFESDASGININNLLKDVNTSKKKHSDQPIPLNPPYEEYFERILTVYNISDKILFLSMIADTLDSDLEERMPGSEIALENPFFRQGHIYNLRHFKKIMSAYKKQTLDFNVDTVPWKELIGFNADNIDFNQIGPEVLQYLAPEIDPESTPNYTSNKTDLYESLDDIPLEEETKKRLKEMNMQFYSPYVFATMNIKDGDNKEQIVFVYNLGNKKVSNIEVTD